MMFGKSIKKKQYIGKTTQFARVYFSCRAETQLLVLSPRAVLPSIGGLINKISDRQTKERRKCSQPALQRQCGQLRHKITYCKKHNHPCDRLLIWGHLARRPKQKYKGGAPSKAPRQAYSVTSFTMLLTRGKQTRINVRLGFPWGACMNNLCYTLSNQSRKKKTRKHKHKKCENAFQAFPIVIKQ